MIARKGTVDEAKVAFQKNTACINEANKDGFSPLILACYSGNNEVIDFLIANNAKPPLVAKRFVWFAGWLAISPIDNPIKNN